MKNSMIENIVMMKCQLFSIILIFDAKKRNIDLNISAQQIGTKLSHIFFKKYYYHIEHLIGKHFSGAISSNLYLA